MQTATVQQSDTLDYAARIKAIVSASSGNLVEWYDYYAYAFTAVYFSAAFFPGGSQTAQLVKSSGIFAIGFLMRPIGAWIFGRIADRYGRKKSMMMSSFMMCGGSLAIAILPTHATIGIMAPVLLTLARMFQGMSVGGEYGSTATYMSEIATKGRRGFLASFQYVTLIGGQLFASALVTVMALFLLTPEQMASWGWRFPFALGSVLSLVALYMRSSLHETARKTSANRADAGSFEALWECRRAFFIVMAFTAGGSLAFYTYTTYMQKFLIVTAHFTKPQASLISTACLFIMMIAQPFFGMLSDRLSRKVMIMTFGILLALLTVPMMTLLGTTQGNALMAGAIIVCLQMVLTFYTSINGLLKAEMFPAHVRALGVSLAYAVSNALFGGTAEWVALSLKGIGYESAFYWFVAGMGVLVVIASLFLHTGEGTLEHE